MNKVRKRIFEIIQIGNKSDVPSKLFDIVVVVAIILNIAAMVLETVESMKPFAGIINLVELVTIIMFTVEYILRLWTADFLYPDKKKWLAVVSFVFSLAGLIDLLTFLPFYLPIVFPAGIVAFRMLRVIRILKLFRINQQYDAFNVITDVIIEKKDQIFSSICLIFMVMIAASLCMYSLEHEAQPEAFKNAFSGIWWSVSTVLTVGYGDIYPITTMGRVMAIIISFLGVGAVAIPTGIISAGFVEQYTKAKSDSLVSKEREIRFITTHVGANHAFVGKRIKDLDILPDVVILSCVRNEKPMVVTEDLTIEAGDILVMGGLRLDYDTNIHIKEIVVKEESDWVDTQIKDLDLSRRKLIVLIKRGEEDIIPEGSTVIKTGDTILLYSRENKRNNN